MRTNEQAIILIMASIIIASGFVSLSLRNRYLELDQRYDELSTEYTGLLAHYDVLYSTHQEMIDQNIDYKEQIIELRQDLDKLERYEGTWRSYRDQYEDVLLENARLLGLLAEQEYGENISLPFVESRKDAYRIGDTIAFEVESEIPLYGSYFTIRDPYGKLVWEGDPLGEWIEIEDYWVAPFYCQTAYHDPMSLTEKYSLGNWTWSFTFGDIIHLNGWFEVIEAARSIENRIPREWINQTLLQSLNLLNMTLKDPYNKYHVTTNTLTWNTINRTHNQGLVSSHFNLTHHIIEFDFQLDNFTFGGGGNRRLITLWAISDTEEVNDTRSYTMLYAEQVTYREGIYELIFHQKQNNENMFVDVGVIYQLNTSYHCRIIRYGDYAMYQVYTNSSKTEMLYDSGEWNLVPDDYQYLYLGYMYPPGKPNDLNITSSGKISNINILNAR